MTDSERPVLLLLPAPSSDPAAAKPKRARRTRKSAAVEDSATAPKPRTRKRRAAGEPAAKRVRKSKTKEEAAAAMIAPTDPIVRAAPSEPPAADVPLAVPVGAPFPQAPARPAMRSATPQIIAMRSQMLVPVSAFGEAANDKAASDKHAGDKAAWTMAAASVRRAGRSSLVRNRSYAGLIATGLLLAFSMTTVVLLSDDAAPKRTEAVVPAITGYQAEPIPTPYLHQAQQVQPPQSQPVQQKPGPSKAAQKSATPKAAQPVRQVMPAQPAPAQPEQVVTTEESDGLAGVRIVDPSWDKSHSCSESAWPYIDQRCLTKEEPRQDGRAENKIGPRMFVAPPRPAAPPPAAPVGSTTAIVAAAPKVHPTTDGVGTHEADDEVQPQQVIAEPAPAPVYKPQRVIEAKAPPVQDYVVTERYVEKSSRERVSKKRQATRTVREVEETRPAKPQRVVAARKKRQPVVAEARRAGPRVVQQAQAAPQPQFFFPFGFFLQAR